MFCVYLHCRTEDCFSYEEAAKCDLLNGTFYHRICYNASEALLLSNSTNGLHWVKKPPAEEYFT